ncbi:uncharacterized protein [Dermacentor andersoni]|uniref:uncharacterized protein n=1 Tax=Dermacentor andersoni TaxID=34620 RepID=UPI002415BC61|nr:uncharacterized protein LOC129382522 [Dermacentor andersoni]
MVNECSCIPPPSEFSHLATPNPPPDMSMATASLPSSAGSSLVASTSADGEASTSKQPHSCMQATVPASVETKKTRSQTRETTRKPSEVRCKGSPWTPLGQVSKGGRAPVIAPKFDIRQVQLFIQIFIEMNDWPKT